MILNKIALMSNWFYKLIKIKAGATNLMLVGLPVTCKSWNC